MRIVIAEDSVLLRDGLSRMLTDGGFEVVEAVPDAGRLLRAVAQHRPDLAVIDVRMPPTHTDEGIKAALVIRRQFPDVALLVLSQYVEESYATDLLSEASSSVGYLLKDRVAHVRDFLDALRRVAAGGTALDPEVVAQLLVRRRDDPMDRLTPREEQVLRVRLQERPRDRFDLPIRKVRDQRRQLLGFLEVEPVRIKDIDRSSEVERRRKIENGWQDRWTYAVPVKRAWRN